MLHTCEGNQIFSENYLRVCECSRSMQMPQTDQITYFIADLPISELPFNISTMFQYKL